MIAALKGRKVKPPRKTKKMDYDQAMLYYAGQVAMTEAIRKYGIVNLATALTEWAGIDHQDGNDQPAGLLDVGIGEARQVADALRGKRPRATSCGKVGQQSPVVTGS